MSSSRELHNYPELVAEVEKAAIIESELGLLFFLTPLNRNELMDGLRSLAGGNKGLKGGGPALETKPVLWAEYPPLEFDPGQMQDKLDAMEHGPAASLGTLWTMRTGQLRRTLELLEARGSGSFTRLAEAEFGRPAPQLLAWAEAILSDPAGMTEQLVSELGRLPDQGWPSLPPPAESTEVDAEEARQYLEAVIGHYQLKGVDVKISDRLTARAMVEGGRLWLQSDILFSNDLLHRLAVHEVGVHLRRRSRRPTARHPLLEMESPHGPGTEEGLTVLTEAHAGCLEPEVLKTYAGRVMAIEKSFGDGAQAVVDYLAESGFTPEEAATLVMRAKRGTADFSQGGAFPKDLCYLDGARNVLEFIRDGGSVAPLFNCLLGIDDLPFLPPGILDQKVEREEE
ncbi:MAG: DUF1704 domain-containing protein [Candidatus Latescibacteria bacterium]|nr:DUF1704 domain-containing protein [Candidatus Latescibacterota bacterium]